MWSRVVVSDVWMYSMRTTTRLQRTWKQGRLGKKPLTVHPGLVVLSDDGVGGRPTASMALAHLQERLRRPWAFLDGIEGAYFTPTLQANRWPAAVVPETVLVALACPPKSRMGFVQYTS
jgi:hypothetical protein